MIIIIIIIIINVIIFEDFFPVSQINKKSHLTLSSINYAMFANPFLVSCVRSPLTAVLFYYFYILY